MTPEDSDFMNSAVSATPVVLWHSSYLILLEGQGGQESNELKRALKKKRFFLL